MFRHFPFAVAVVALALVACGDDEPDAAEYRADLTLALDAFVSANAELVKGGFPEGDRQGYRAFFESYRGNFDRLHDDLAALDAPEEVGGQHDALRDAVDAVSSRVGEIMGRDLGGEVGTAEAILLARLYSDLEAAETACTELDAALKAADEGPTLPCDDFGRFASPSG